MDVSTSDRITLMLEKQRSHNESKAKATKAAAKEVMKELHLRSGIDFKGLHVPPRPPHAAGYMFKIGKVLGGRNRRYFEMNPTEGTLIKYMTKQDCPKSPKEIYCIAEIEGLTRQATTGAQKFHFFEFSHKRKHKFCCCSEKAANLWFQYINCAITYCNFFKKLSDSVYQDKIPAEVKATNSELLELILKEPEEQVEIEDTPPQEAPALKKIEEKKEEEEEKEEKGKESEKEKRAPPSPPTRGRNLIQEIENDKEVFGQTPKVGFSSFKIIEKIGAGAFGQIFKAQLLSTGEIFAMKTISKEYLFKTKQLKYALSECKLLKAVDHPFVIKMHYAFQTPKHLYFVLDFCGGGDLSMHLGNKQIFDEVEARFYIAELVLAIEYLHVKNIIYRDLKPDNVLIAADGHIKLSDFGLAKQMYGQNPPAALSFCGSPAYLSPEMLFKRGANKALDVYGIGTVLYELMVGLPPYYDDDMKTMYRNIAYGKLKVPKYLSFQARAVLKVHKETATPNRKSLKGTQRSA